MIKRRLYTTKESIVKGIRDRDEYVLDHLYRECYPMIKKLVLTNNGNEDDAKEIRQNGIIIFYQKVSDMNFVLTCEPKTFIYSVCSNLWKKELRERGKWGAWVNPGWDIVDTGEEEDDEPEGLGIEKIKEWLEKIGKKCKEIIILYYLKNFSLDQIVVKMGLKNRNVAKTKRYKCFLRLQKAAGYNKKN